MSRRTPTTGAKPNRDEPSHFAEDIWEWIKEHQNVVLLSLTILIVATVIFVIRSRTATQRQKQAQEAIGRYFYERNPSDDLTKRVKQIKSNISKYEGVGKLTPWFHLQLANVYYEHQKYDKAIRALQTLQEKYPESQPARQADHLLSGIKSERSFVTGKLQKRKKRLKRKQERNQKVFGIRDNELPVSSSSSSQENQS